MPKNALIVDDYATLRATMARGVPEATTRIADVMALGPSLGSSLAAASTTADLILQDVRLPETSHSGFVEAARNSIGK